MCGRYLVKDVEAVDEVVRRVFGFGMKLDRPRYIVAPYQLLPVVATGPDGKPRSAEMRWGLAPFWDKSPKPKVAPINARAEDVLTKPMFRQSLQRRRCLVPADGFYEWRKLSPDSKVTYLIRRREGHPFFFAGIHESATDDRPETFALLTTGPNKLMEQIHNRMPIVLDEESGPQWLEPGEMTSDRLAAFAEPYPADGMEAWPISTLVNSPRNDVPEVLVREDQLL